MPFLVVTFDFETWPDARVPALDVFMTQLGYVVQTPKGHPLPRTTYVRRYAAHMDINTVIEVLRMRMSSIQPRPRSVLAIESADPDIKIGFFGPEVEGAEAQYADMEPDLEESEDEEDDEDL
jgi:hypothetical protein